MPPLWFVTDPGCSHLSQLTVFKFTSLGQGELSLILAGTLNIGQLVAVVAAFIIDKVGRRPLVIWGAVIMGTPYVIIAALYGLYSHDWPSYPAQGWTAVAMAYIYIIGYGISYSPLAWTLPSEVYSTTQRAKGAALATATVWISNFIVGVATPPMIAQAGFGTVSGPPSPGRKHTVCKR